MNFKQVNKYTQLGEGTASVTSNHFTISMLSSQSWVNERYSDLQTINTKDCMVQVYKPPNGSAGDMYLKLYGYDVHTGEKTFIGTWTIEDITGAPTYKQIYLGDLTRYSNYYFSASFAANGGNNDTVHITVLEKA